MNYYVIYPIAGHKSRVVMLQPLKIHKQYQLSRTVAMDPFNRLQHLIRPVARSFDLAIDFN